MGTLTLPLSRWEGGTLNCAPSADAVAGGGNRRERGLERDHGHYASWRSFSTISAGNSVEAAALDLACSGVRIPGMVTAAWGFETQNRMATSSNDRPLVVAMSLI